VSGGRRREIDRRPISESSLEELRVRFKEWAGDEAGDEVLGWCGERMGMGKGMSPPRVTVSGVVTAGLKRRLWIRKPEAGASVVE
jgi:hypothetical protein